MKKFGEGLTLQEFSPSLENRMQRSNRQRLPKPPRTRQKELAPINPRNKAMQICRFIDISIISFDKLRKCICVCCDWFHG